jgi:hypothetical protein
VKVETRKLDWKVNSKIGSLENVKHRPGGGTIKIFNERYGTSRSSSEVRASPSATRSPSPPTNTSGHTSRKASVELKKVQTPPSPKPISKQSSAASSPSPVISSRNTSRPGSAKPSASISVKPSKPVTQPSKPDVKPIITNGTADLLGNVQNQLNQLILDQPIPSSIAQQDLLA